MSKYDKLKPQGRIKSSCYPEEWFEGNYGEWASSLRKGRMTSKEYLVMIERDKAYS